MVINNTFATSLLENALDKPDFKAINIGKNTEITFPYYEYYVSVGPHDFMPDWLELIYNVGISVWGESNLPKEWKDFFIEICELRELKGIQSPFSPFSAVLIILEEDAQLTEQMNIGLNIEELDIEEVLFNANLIKLIFNYFLNNPNLKERLKLKLVDFVYYHSADWIRLNEVVKFIESKAIKNGIIVDAGCGNGDLTNTLSTNNRVIGFDLQYHPTRFSEDWKKGKNLFMQANATNMPFASNSVDAVTITSVVGHLNIATIEKILTEVSRVLKVSGYFIIGPQKTNNSNKMYRYFIKNDCGQLQELEG